MKASRMLPMPLLSRYNQALEKSQLSIVCSRRISAQQLAGAQPVTSKKKPSLIHSAATLTWNEVSHQAAKHALGDHNRM